MKHAIRTTVLLAATLAATTFGGTTSPAYAEGPCPAGSWLDIESGARIHRSSDLASPVDGIYYKGHQVRIRQVLGSPGVTPEWVNITDLTTNVTGWVHGSVTSCLASTSP
ncbi:hypothetical protein SAMN05421805_10636 [Saccharopolyspora antimicrobica]|uniref:SH3 domain-containing protein n=1 Tax=Saccharopolyspora antimicrobica TaxID=455193 RepID=A0A1I5AX40_9PSEU|nr:hypothetical protein [Saccharopolyspora antimicrobica]RKT86395.1 hypothetical protein ATL45_4762 [Saccharopolyspora antimicrobica]SFN67018.1 hypothetical protein SAMN05421805_10636 [Saccharopolyspora antimicrobica]